MRMISGHKQRVNRMSKWLEANPCCVSNGEQRALFETNSALFVIRTRGEFIPTLCSRLECVVNALCRGLSHASTSLARLVLDMNLSGEQVSRVCDALRDCVQVQALHLPHLGCGCEGLASVAELLKERPLLALNLAGSWGAKNEDPSSSGISMGKTVAVFYFISLPFLFVYFLLRFFLLFFLCHFQLLLQSWTPRRSQNSKNSGNAYTVGVSFLSLLISDGSVCTSFGKLKGSTKLGIIKKKKRKKK